MNDKKKEKFEEKVYDFTNSVNEPWLMNSNLEESILDPKTGEPLTAEYIWGHIGNDREELVKRVFTYFRSKNITDFIDKLSDEELLEKYTSLKKSNSKSIFVQSTDEIVNSATTCTDVLKHFSGELFFSAEGEKKGQSCKAIFEDDEKLLKVLRNRMGYRISKEDGRERPFVFSMSNKMLFQGMRSSGLAYSVSIFKPIIAKGIIESLYNQIENPYNKVFDYSAGWGARALGAGSLEKEYHAIDPLTYDKVNSLMKFYNIAGKVYCGGSEEQESYKQIISDDTLKNKFDICISSPPYFTLENYNFDQKEQSVNKYPDYKDWLEKYWNQTVKNCVELVLRKDSNRRFVLVMLEKYKKFDLAKDMVSICENNGLILDKTYSFRTSKSHLSNKINTKQVSKNTEKVFVFK